MLCYAERLTLMTRRRFPLRPRYTLTDVFKKNLITNFRSRMLA